MILTKEAKEFIFDMVPICIKRDSYFYWEFLINRDVTVKTSDNSFKDLLKDCWNSLTMSDKKQLMYQECEFSAFDILESIFNEPNDENELLDAILDFKGFKGKVWEDE